MHIAAVGTALPRHYYDQEALLNAFLHHWGAQHFNTSRLEGLHRAVCVGGRHLALPIEAYADLESFGQANDAWIEVALEIGASAIESALEQAGLCPADVDALWFVTVTGLAVPSVDARLMNRMGFRRDLKRTPIFGLGCVAGAAGVARVADYLAGHPKEVAVLLSVELCSLTLQRDDFSIPNLISSGLFGDGAAAVVMVGADHPKAESAPAVLASRSVFYPDTERVMGWDISERGFGVVLSADVPRLVSEKLGADVDAFLRDQGLDRSDIACWICHPGGPKVLEAFQQALGQPRDAFELTWNSLMEVGNLSSASVLFVLRDTLAMRWPEPGSYALLLAMGPAFCSELVLLRC